MNTSCNPSLITVSYVWLYSAQNDKHISAVGAEAEGKNKALSQIQSVPFWIAYM
jgi:hypothetical protein